MPTPESWYADADAILQREQRRAAPATPSNTGPTRCLSGECMTCDDCIEWFEANEPDYPIP